MGTRMFVGVLPPEHVVEHLEEFLAPRREAARFRWSLPEQWHLTLAFAASVPDRAHDDLVARLASAAARRTPFQTALEGGGAFPDPTRARVLYAGLAADPEVLDLLATGARHAASTAGVEVDGQRFRPHVTLARMNRPVEATRWIRVLETYRGPAWTVEDVVLVASHLGEGPGGRPRYEVAETFSLGPAGSGRG